MKIDRTVCAPRLYMDAAKYLPPSLVVGSCIEGYSRGYYVYQRGDKPWIGRGDPIAELERETIRLFHTNYFSDMEALALAYEKETGHEVTLKYCQLPKEEPLHPSSAAEESRKEK